MLAFLIRRQNHFKSQEGLSTTIFKACLKSLHFRMIFIIKMSKDFIHDFSRSRNHTLETSLPHISRFSKNPGSRLVFVIMLRSSGPGGKPKGLYPRRKTPLKVYCSTLKQGLFILDFSPSLKTSLRSPAGLHAPPHTNTRERHHLNYFTSRWPSVKSLRLSRTRA